MEEVQDEEKPKLNMEFAEEQLAYNFYNAYAGRVGFSIRVDYRNNDRHMKKVITNSRFVCYRAGHKKPDKRYNNSRNPRPEVRVGCSARLGVKLHRESAKYFIYEFIEEHNHELAPPGTRHMLKSQRKVTDVNPEPITVSVDSEIGRRDAFPFLNIDQNNYLWTKRQKEMGNGGLCMVLKYLQDKALENPSFFYAFQLDSDCRIINIFWADAQMQIDYSLFGDEVTFDTMYKINDAHQPCAAFVGFNHHRMPVVFGAALMYDETVDSFRWLLDTFLAAMNNKHSKSIFTDHDAGMAEAIAGCMPNTFHGLCIWHLSLNALKNVPLGKVDGQGVHSILSRFYYDVETEEDFEALWDMMLDENKLHDNDWVKETYGCRSKWAFVYIKNQWTARNRSTQLSESFISKLKMYLNSSDYDLQQFFHHFDRILSDIRYKELEAEFFQSQTCPRIYGPMKMLKASSTTYTKTIFEEFQDEYFRSIESVINGQCVVDEGGDVEYIVKYEEEVRKVVKDNEGRLSCCCKLFERRGLLCSHALKVLREVLNLLELPEHYILKRWTRKARALSITNSFTASINADGRVDKTSRLRDLLSTYNLILTRASDCPESYEEVVKNAQELSIRVERIIANKLAGNNDGVNKGNGNCNVVDCAGVKGLKRKMDIDPYPEV